MTEREIPAELRAIQARADLVTQMLPLSMRVGVRALVEQAWRLGLETDPDEASYTVFPVDSPDARYLMLDGKILRIPKPDGEPS